MKEMPVADYAGHGIEPRKGAIAELEARVRELASLERVLEGLGEQAETAAKRARQLREDVIPRLMEDLENVDGVQALPDGTRVEVEPKVYAKIPEETEEAAFAWLEANGYGEIIKRQIVVAFRTGQKKEAEALLEELRGRFAAVKKTSDVHSSTLGKWARDRLREGRPVDPSISVVQLKVAKITRPEKE